MKSNAPTTQTAKPLADRIAAYKPYEPFKMVTGIRTHQAHLHDGMRADD